MGAAQPRTAWPDATRPDTTRPSTAWQVSSAPMWDESAWDEAEWHEVRRPRLRLVEDVPGGSHPVAAAGGGLTRRTIWRRRLGVVAIVALLTAALTLAVGDLGATADAGAAPTAYAVVEPGQTLWDVAVDSAPQGTDPRDYLHRIEELNGLETAAVPAWTVVVLPPR